MSFSVSKQNIIKFKRIDSPNILNYKIYAVSGNMDSTVKTLIATIPNVKVDQVNDNLQYTHIATSKTKYVVTPVVSLTNTIGDHNIIK